MSSTSKLTPQQAATFATHYSCLTQAFSLKNALNSLPLNVAVNAVGDKYLNPLPFNENMPQIKQEVVSFSKAIESLPFEIPLFDDSNFCTKEAVLSAIIRTPNVAALCYNKAVLTIYNEMTKEFGQDIAISAFSDASSQAEEHPLL